MIIKIQYYPDVECEEELDALDAEYTAHCTTLREAEAQLEIIQRAQARHNVMEFD